MKMARLFSSALPLAALVVNLTYIVFTRKGTNAKSHYLQHLDIKPYYCPTCGKRFLRKNDCKRHSVMHNT
jgi:predicted RNA-binding Zn-ribbon protein involved in translation (DUF1610 family)